MASKKKNDRENDRKNDGKNDRKHQPTETAAPETPARHELLIDGNRGETHDGSFPIAGLGASAGGLEALGEFFSRMPRDAGIGFVVVTHLHAGQPSLLAE